MAKISNTTSYPGQSPIEGADYLIGTAANSNPIAKQTKTFTIQGIADFVIDAAFDGVSYRLPIFTAATAGLESVKLVNSLFYQDTASLGGKVSEVLGTTVYLDNGSGVGSLIVAQNISAGSNLTVTGNSALAGTLTVGGNTTLGTDNTTEATIESVLSIQGPVKDSTSTLGNSEQVLVSDGTGQVTWQNFQGSGLEYQSAWNALTNVPDLQAYPLTADNTGKYWVVSIAGTTPLTDAAGGTITDWEPGDWAIISEDIAGNVFWDKIDNSSVLTGQGTTGNIAIWTAPRELGDAPIKLGTGATSLIFNTSSQAIGDNSNAFGVTSIAQGQVSFAAGNNAVATGNYSVAIGQNVIASGIISTAMGNGADSTGTASVAIGNRTLSSGAGATAIGEDTTASGAASLASNSFTEATGDYSVAMGDGSLAIGEGSFSMGKDSVATGIYSVAMGEIAHAVGVNSVSLGYINDANGIKSLAIGSGNVSNSDKSVTLGDQNIAGVAAGNGKAMAIGYENNSLGQQSVSIGEDNTVNSSSGIALGASNTVNGDFAFAQGKSNTVEGSSAVGIGYQNIISVGSQFAVAIGDENQANATNAVAIGNDCLATAANSTVIGDNSTASGINSIAIGKTATATGVTATAIGASTTSSGIASIALNNSTVASGDNSFASGFESTALNLAGTAMGYRASASGDYTFAAGYLASTASIGAVAIGYDVSAAGNYSVAIGSEVLADDPYTISIGHANASNGDNALTIGNNLNSFSFKETVLGSYNANAAGGQSKNTWVSSERLLTVGNGPSVGNESNALILLKSGDLQLPTYGLGNVAGTATYNLAVTSDGKVIEVATGGGGSGVTGSGTANFITKWNSGSSITDSVMFEGSSKIGIGNQSPNHTLDVTGDINIDGGSLLFSSAASAVPDWSITTDVSGDLIIDEITGPENVIFRNGGNMGVGLTGSTTPQAKLDVNGGIRMGDDSFLATASNVGTQRYRVSGNNSYVDMVMQTGATTYAWINIVQNNW
tara:strand:+ start:1033 stop:4056 length:3024 start_codon:yes stop_codon:yes gene_type:complete